MPQKYKNARETAGVGRKMSKFCQMAEWSLRQHTNRLPELKLLNNVIELLFKCRINVDVSFGHLDGVNHSGVALQTEKPGYLPIPCSELAGHHRKHRTLVGDVAAAAARKTECAMVVLCHQLVKKFKFAMIHRC